MRPTFEEFSASEFADVHQKVVRMSGGPGAVGRGMWRPMSSFRACGWCTRCLPPEVGLFHLRYSMITDPRPRCRALDILLFQKVIFRQRGTRCSSATIQPEMNNNPLTARAELVPAPLSYLLNATRLLLFSDHGSAERTRSQRKCPPVTALDPWLPEQRAILEAFFTPHLVYPGAITN